VRTHRSESPGRVRDAALRRTRAMIAGVTAGAVALSGALSVVAAQAFKGHTRQPTPAAATTQSLIHN
jgi:hypothetical protein